MTRKKTVQSAQSFIFYVHVVMYSYALKGAVIIRK